MKKILFATLAVAAIASCAKTEPTYVGGESEIMLNPVTTVATKANQLKAITGTQYPAAEAFDVYAYWINDAGVKSADYLTAGTSGVEFVNKGTYWGGTTTYYWPKNGSLRFAAYSPSTLDMTHDYELDTYKLENHVYPTVDGVDVTEANYTANTYDILVAATTEPYTAETGASKVSVKFEHALAWLNIKLQSTGVANGAFTVKKVVINEVAKKGTLVANMAAEKVWKDLDIKSGIEAFVGSYKVTDEAVLKETVDNGLLVLPQAPTTVTIYYDQNALEDENGNPTTPALTDQVITVPLVLDNAEDTWEPGKKYTYTILFDLDEILINPTVEDWEVEDEVIVNSDAVAVTTASEILAAVAEGKDNIVLTQDIDLDAVLTKAVPEAGLVLNHDIVIDGRGHKLSTTAVRAIQIIDAKNVTIKNLELVAGGERGIQLQRDAQTLVVENVKAISKNYTLNITANGTNAKVTVNDCDFQGLCVVNVWGENAEVEINNTTLRCEDNVDEGYAVVCNNAPNGKVVVNGGEVVITGTKPEGTVGGSITTSGAQVIFNDTEGNCVVDGQNFAINYDDGYRYIFTTFAEALEVAVDGETIVLLQDVELIASEMHVPDDRDIVVDLNGKTVTVKSLDPIKNHGTMTLKNGKVVADNSENTRRCVYNYGIMTIDGVEFVQTYSKKGAAINNEGVMTINDAVVDAVFYSVWTSGANAVTTINGGSFTTTNDVNDKENWAYAISSLSGSKTVINDATVVGNHGCVAADSGAVVEVNSGKYNCTATYTGNSDWVFYAEGATLTYDANACELTTANPNGTIWEGCTTVTAK